MSEPGFYKLDNGEMLYSADSVYFPDGTFLLANEHESYTYPIQGWTWIGTEEGKQSIITMTTLIFMRRFTPQERISIRASTDPILVDFLWLLGQAPNVRLDDPDTIAGVNYVESIGLITPSRAAQILSTSGE